MPYSDAGAWMGVDPVSIEGDGEESEMSLGVSVLLST